MTTLELSPRRRVARLSLVATVLAVVALVLVGVAVWLSLTPSDHGQVGLLPMGISYSPPRAAFFGAVAASVAAVFVGLAALEAAAALRVLARDRQIPAPLSAQAQRMRRGILGPIGVARLDLDHPLEPLPAVRPDTVTPLVRCTVLIPAHDEATIIGETLRSLRGQTRAPDRVVVVADNCTDDTVEIAHAAGVEVIATVGNTEKKAGALNQVLHDLLPNTGDADVVLVMDADSTIAPEFLEVGLGALEADPDLMAVGGLFFGEDGGGFIGQLQRNEYTRYQRLVARKLGRVYVLTGTASIFRAYAFQAVAEARGLLIPGPPGKVYDTLALTEDNEMTLALKTLGAKLVSPQACHVVTELMTSWRALWRQRLRWHRGALENIGAYGLTRATSVYWLQQLGLGYGVIALNSYFLLMTITLLSADSFQMYWFWTLIGLIFVVERMVTVWAVGWPGRLIAAPLILELGYVLFLQAVFLTSLLQIVTGRKAGWNYVPREEAET